MKTVKMFVYVMMIIFVAGCGGEKELDSSVEKLGRASGKSPSQAQMGMPPGMASGMPSGMASGMPSGMAKMGEPAGGTEQPIHEGEIVETINVPTYTYIKFSNAKGEQLWAAVLQGKFEIGQKVKIKQSIVMKQFTSPSLNRTFDSVIFGVIDDGKKPSDEHPASVTQRDGGSMPMPSKKSSTKPLPPGHPKID